MPRLDHLTGPARWLRHLSQALDDSIPFDDRMLTWIRVTKVAEEVGEVIDALNGAEGTNPRKGVTRDWDDVRKELLDVAATALLAWEHLDGNEGFAMDAFAEHVAFLAKRQDEAMNAAREVAGKEER